MKKLFIIAPILLLGILALTACTNPFARRNNNSNPTPSLADALAKQSEMKTFSSLEELKKFFENRPNNAATNIALRNEGVLGMGEAKDSAIAPQATGLGGGGAYSTTNIQVAGVDESDIVKTDGQYLYTISDQKVVIIEAKPAVDAKIIAEISAQGRPQELYLDGDKLVIFGYEEIVYSDVMPSLIRPMNPKTFLSVYDISNKTTPNLIKNLKFEGTYIGSRLIDGRVYFISTIYNFYPTDDIILPAVYENDEKISGENSNDRYAYPTVYYIDTPSAYNATTVSIIDLANLDAALKSNVYFMPAGQTIYASRGNLYLSYTKYISEYELRMTVARELMFDRLSDRERSRINQISNIDSAILSDDEKASKINQIIESYLYRLPENEQISVMKTLNEEFNRRYSDLYKAMETTVIHKIALDNGSLNYKGSGEVSGHLLNQFSMDESDGYFRMATTRGQSWIIPFPIIATKLIAESAPVNQESYNNVFVLDENMKTIGSLENLAPGERIYSARFMGDRAYLVTFKQTDPLFVIDLKTPNAPQVIGQIKLPGFSNYLHPFNETTLIGVGKQATDKGDQGVELGGLKVSLFNVANPSEPKEITSVVFGGNGSDSSVLYDHKAFLFSADKQLLVIPANLTSPNSQNYSIEFQGALVLQVTDNTLSERGRIVQNTSAQRITNGFTPTESIQRALYIDNNLYTVSSSIVQINQLDSLEKIKQIDLPVNTGSGIEPGPKPLSSPAVRVIE